MILLLALAAAIQGAPVRFHHAHYRVGDPAVAMSEAAARLNGTARSCPGSAWAFVLATRMSFSTASMNARNAMTVA